MEDKKSKSLSDRFDRFAHIMTMFTGSTSAFTIAFLIIIVWVISGPIFNYSDTWQLVINTGTTIVTFLMVFLIQRSQNKDSLALHLKLNELVASSEKASKRLIDVEDLTEQELEILHKYYQMLARREKDKNDFEETHSFDEKIRKDKT